MLGGSQTYYGHGGIKPWPSHELPWAMLYKHNTGKLYNKLMTVTTV